MGYGAYLIGHTSAQSAIIRLRRRSRVHGLPPPSFQNHPSLAEPGYLCDGTKPGACAGLTHRRARGSTGRQGRASRATGRDATRAGARTRAGISDRTAPRADSRVRQHLFRRRLHARRGIPALHRRPDHVGRARLLFAQKLQAFRYRREFTRARARPCGLRGQGRMARRHSSGLLRARPGHKRR